MSTSANTIETFAKQRRDTLPVEQVQHLQTGLGRHCRAVPARPSELTWLVPAALWSPMQVSPEPGSGASAYLLHRFHLAWAGVASSHRYEKGRWRAHQVSRRPRSRDRATAWLRVEAPSLR